jgi:ketosteroid isomerase-like protein
MGRDAGAIASLFDDTLVYVDYDGSLRNRAEYLQSVASPSSSPEHMYDEGMKVHVYSNAGVVSGVYRETGVTKGKAYTRRARFTDTWIKQSGQWKCVASQSTLIQ